MPKVKEYMTYDVVTVSPGDTIRDVVKIIKKTGHDSFPVVSNGKIKGYVSSTDLLLCDPDETINEVMSKEPIVAHPDMELEEAARVIFRSGISKLPVVDDRMRLVGIIANEDVIRSQIERVDVAKLMRVRGELEKECGIKLSVRRGRIPVGKIVPTQTKVYADELQGRIYELKKGLAEPLIVIKKPDALILFDGHHRAIAARELGIKMVDAYIILIKTNKKLKVENPKLKKLEDVKILDYAKHPLVAVTERFLKKDR
jgi:IMP dehydrogenase